MAIVVAATVTIVETGAAEAPLTGLLIFFSRKN
jgi:hypothetical protein